MSVFIPRSSKAKQAVKRTTTSVCQPLCTSPMGCSSLTLNFCRARQRAVWNLSFFISIIIFKRSPFAKLWVTASKNPRHGVRPPHHSPSLWRKKWMSTTIGNFDRGPATLMRPFACRAIAAGLFILKTHSGCLILIVWLLKSVCVTRSSHSFLEGFELCVLTCHNPTACLNAYLHAKSWSCFFFPSSPSKTF